jgi:hypothetical protein
MEDTTPPRRNDTLLLGGIWATRSSSMRFTEPQGHTKESPVPPRRSTRSSTPPPYTLRYPSYGFIIMSGEERRNSLALRRGLWRMPTSTIKLSTHWVLAQPFIICWGTLDWCNSPTGCRQIPTRNLPCKF